VCDLTKNILSTYNNFAPLKCGEYDEGNWHCGRESPSEMVRVMGCDSFQARTQYNWLRFSATCPVQQE
jgi:hypothetical protein